MKLACQHLCFVCLFSLLQNVRYAGQRAKFTEKVHKPPLGFNVINFELNGFNASIWVPWSPSDRKKIGPKSCTYNLLWGLWTFSPKLAECAPRPKIRYCEKAKNFARSPNLCWQYLVTSKQHFFPNFLGLLTIS